MHRSLMIPFWLIGLFSLLNVTLLSGENAVGSDA